MAEWIRKISVLGGALRYRGARIGIIELRRQIVDQRLERVDDGRVGEDLFLDRVLALIGVDAGFAHPADLIHQTPQIRLGGTGLMDAVPHICIVLIKSLIRIVCRQNVVYIA